MENKKGILFKDGNARGTLLLRNSDVAVDVIGVHCDNGTFFSYEDTLSDKIRTTIYAIKFIFKR